METKIVVDKLEAMRLEAKENKRDYSIPSDSVKHAGAIEGLTKKYGMLKGIKRTAIIEKLDKVELGVKQNIFIHGERGNGKTIGIQWFMEKLHDNNLNWKIKYMTLAEISMDLYAKDFKERADYIKMLATKYDVLFIDEIDKVSITDYKEEMIFYLLDTRLSGMKYTIMTSNFDVSELSKKLKENIMSRILADCIKIKSDGEVLR